MPAGHPIVLFGAAVLIAGLVGLVSVTGNEPAKPAVSPTERSMFVLSTGDIDPAIARVLTNAEQAFSGSPGVLPDEIVRVLVAHGAAGRTSTRNPTG